MHRLIVTAITCVIVFAAGIATAADPIRILFLSKSSGFEHSSIRHTDGQPSHVDKVLTALAKKMGASLTATKDASMINEADLENYDVLIFYTTGDLTQPSKDGGAPMPDDGLDALMNWIRKGGGFLGYHCATDTFGHHWEDEDQPYIRLIGGQFRTHGKQFEGIVRVVDQDHPTMTHQPDGWQSLDEWYLFRNMNEEDVRVLALLDPGPEREKQEMYNVPPYPVVWCRAFGAGRVYYNAMGHREGVWDEDIFQQTVVDAIHWTNGTGDLGAESNYAEVMKEVEGSESK